MPSSFQEWVHWLELGRGARLIRRLAGLIAVVLLSLLIGYKQFHGPKTEWTIRQAIVGRQLADGLGFTTLVNDPQTAAWLLKHGPRWGARAFPELHSAPLYPALIGAWFQLLPETFRHYFFATSPTPPAGFIPDYLLLGLNVALLWLAVYLTYRLGKLFFEPLVGIVAGLAVLLTAAFWQQVMGVNGTALSMVLVLLLSEFAWRVEIGSRAGDVPYRWLILTGLTCGALFLTDYAAGVSMIAAGIFVGLRFAGERLRALSALILGFLFVASPWSIWMTARTSSPVGLALQDVALKVDGSSADPAIVRATLSTTPPMLELAKFGNKGLSSLQLTLSEKFWSGGAQWFAGFFVASFLYRFRDPRVQALRFFAIALWLSLVVADAFLDSGEGERLPATYLSPLLIVFGVGFCSVLIASSEDLARHARWVFTGLLVLQAVPLCKDLLEPSRLHFQYPPYYPPLFQGMRTEMSRRGGINPGWMCDVPAGAAWYSGQRVWGQPASLHDFFAIGAEQPMLALVLTPKTLDRPFFSELTHSVETENSRVGDWAQIYTGLAVGHLPPAFPLSLPQKIADNFYVLIDPQAQPLRRK